MLDVRTTDEIRLPRKDFRPFGRHDPAVVRANLAATARLFGRRPARLVLVDERGRSWLQRWRELGNSRVKNTRAARRRRRG